MYVVVVSNSYHQINVVGTTEQGDPIKSASRAADIVRQIEKNNPHLDALVVEIEPSGYLQGIDYLVGMEQ